MTPEGRVKAKIDRTLNEHKPGLWYHKPVQNGMGKPCLDYHGVIFGRYFAIEAKAPGERPTPRQRITMDEIEKAGGQTFVIDGDAGVYALEQWLLQMQGLTPLEQYERSL